MSNNLSESILQKRIKRFKSIKRGYYSLIAIISLYILSLIAPLWVNDKPLMVRYANNQYDSGEKFEDINNNGNWDLEEPFDDKVKYLIQCLVLNHGPQKFETYQEEIQYLIEHEQRNNFIKNLTLDLKGNTLVLFSRVEAHGQVLYDLINTNKRDDHTVFFVHGGVDAEERELVREITEKEKNAIIVASYGTFSTGINIKRLHNVIFASPSKSRIRNLQSIGRVLRKGKDKVKAILYDIADDCTKNSRRNYTLNHFIERIKIYNEENFNYEIISIQLRK